MKPGDKVTFRTVPGPDGREVVLTVKSVELDRDGVSTVTFESYPETGTVEYTLFAG